MADYGHGTWCAACPGPAVCRPVRSQGPCPATTLFLGAGPGPVEAQTGVPYSGKAGQEFNGLYLALAQMPRSTVHVANAQQCWTGDDKVQEKRMRTCAEHHLPRLLGRVKPEAIVLMGGVTCRLADERIRLDLHHGVPRWGSVLGGAWEGWIWPMYEPALGMRETTRMTALMDDFRNLGAWVRGEWAPPSPPDVRTDYRLVTSPVALREYLRLDRPVGRPAIDTEKHGDKPWSVQVSHTPSTGRLIRAEGMVEEYLLEEFNWWLQETRAEVVLHHAPGDLDLLERLYIRPVSFRDTMQEAYHQCSLPQGLKALTYRLFGVTMRSWEDVVWPASVSAFIEWAAGAVSIADERLSTELVTKTKRGKCADCGHQHTTGPCKRCSCESTRVTFEKVVHEPSAAVGILAHIVRHTVDTAEEDEPYDPWDALARMRVDGLRGKKAEKWQWEYLEGELGPVPILGIGNCELEDAKEYAIGDADWTGQVATELEVRRGSDRWRIAEEDIGI